MKGMIPRIRKGEFFIRLDEGFRRRKGYVWESIGLAIHCTKKSQTYTITHIKSGRRIFYKIPDYSIAINILREMYQVLKDWNWLYEDLIHDKPAYKALAKEMIKIQKRYTPYGVKANIKV